jgi:ABC-2 type transport system permease protein
MNKMWLVARREYLFNLRRRAFLFTAFILPLLIVGVMILMITWISSREKNEESAGQVGYVDQSGVLAEAVSRPNYFIPYDDEESAQQALAEGAVGAYFVLPEDYMMTGRVRLYSASSVPQALHNSIEGFLIANLGTHLDPNIPVERIQKPVELIARPLDRGVDLREDASVGIFMMPVVFAIVFAISVQLSGGYLVAGMIEEKSNRIMELLVTSVTPTQLLAGKIIGLGALGLTQLLIWLGVVGLSLQAGRGGSIEWLNGLSVTPTLAVMAVIYFLLSYFLTASLLAGIGASFETEQESRTISSIVSLVQFIPYFFIVVFLARPNGLLAVLLTLFPLTAPLSAIMRLALGSVPVWQLAVSVGLLALTTVGAIIMAARVFRWAMLMYGKRPSLRELLAVIRQSPPATTTPQEQTL